MATGLMDNRYTNTTPAGFERVGGNPNKAETITPDTTAMAPNVGAGGGEEITDTGTTPNTKSRVAQVFDNLSENAKTSLAAVASPDTITALKEFFSGMGMSPEDIQTLIYSTGKENGYSEKLRDWFKLIYEVVFGEENGPRMGFFISFFGVNETKELIINKIK